MASETSRKSLDRERRIQLAVSNYKNGHLTSIRKAARVHDVAYGTLRERLIGVSAKCDTTPEVRELSVSQEDALVKYILNLNVRGFPPKPRYVREMTSVLVARDLNKTVGKNWVSRFVNRRNELKSIFTRL
jgi:hypothetical protein